MKTLAQYALLETDVLIKGVQENIINVSPLAQYLPFTEAPSETYKYNVELTMPRIPWVQSNDVITEQAGTTEERTNTVRQLIGDVDTDKGKIDMNKLQDPEAIDIATKTKAMAYELEYGFLWGSTTTESTASQPKGILRMIAEFESTSTTDLDGIVNSQVIPSHATSEAITLDDLDELIDAVKPGAPDMVMMTRRIRRKIGSLARASGTTLRHDKNDYGTFINIYNNVQIMVNDFMTDNLPNGTTSVLAIADYDRSAARAASYDNSFVLALKFGDGGVHGAQVGKMKHEYFDKLEKKNAVRNRFTWYLTYGCYQKYSAAVLINCLDTAL